MHHIQSAFNHALQFMKQNPADYNAAIKEFEALVPAISYSEENKNALANIYSNLGIAYTELARIAYVNHDERNFGLYRHKAQQNISQALEFDSSNHRTLCCAARIRFLFINPNYDDVTAVLSDSLYFIKRAILSKPDYYRAYFYQACIAHMLGYNEMADKQLNIALRLCPVEKTGERKALLEIQDNIRSVLRSTANEMIDLFLEITKGELWYPAPGASPSLTQEQSVRLLRERLLTFDVRNTSIQGLCADISRVSPVEYMTTQSDSIYHPRSSAVTGTLFCEASPAAYSFCSTEELLCTDSALVEGDQEANDMIESFFSAQLTC